MSKLKAMTERDDDTEIENHASPNL